MTKIRRIDFSPDEFLAGVAGQFTPTDLGLYWVICSLIYSRGGPIENDPKWLSRLFKDTDLRIIRNSLDRLLASGKVSQVVDKLVVSRCINELQVSRNRVISASQNAGKRWVKRNRNEPIQKVADAGALSSAMLTINHQPSTITAHMLEGETCKPENEPLDRKSAEQIYRVTGIWKAEWGSRPETTSPVAAA